MILRTTSSTQSEQPRKVCIKYHKCSEIDKNQSELSKITQSSLIILAYYLNVLSFNKLKNLIVLLNNYFKLFKKNCFNLLFSAAVYYFITCQVTLQN